MAQEITKLPTRDVARGQAAHSTRATNVYRPNSDIYEDENHIVLVTDMPGVAPGDVDVTLEQRVLTIRGRLGVERPEGYRAIYSEYGEGNYERAFTLSEDIDQDHIEANHKDGVLTLKLPKAERAKTKKIQVKTA